MDLNLEGNTVIVTGGATGIGAAIAVALAGEGCDVAIVDQVSGITVTGLITEIEALGRRAIAVKADVRSLDGAVSAVSNVVDRWGKLDALVCNAGITSDAVIWKMSEDQWDDVLAVNLKGYFNYNKAAATVFKSQRSGSVVNVASINGMRGKFGQANYSASKGGVIALSKTLARELGKYGVNVNVVAPGMVMTEMARGIPQEFVEAAVNETMLGRIADPGDVANAVLFLCSDRARHITGEVIKVDGGQYI